MNQRNQLNQYQLVQCQVMGHQDCHVNRICLVEDCQEPTVNCDLCIKLHKNHRSQLLPIAEIQQFYSEMKKSNRQNETLSRINKILDDFETLSTIKLKQLVADLKQQLDFSKLTGNSFLNNKLASYSELRNQAKLLSTFFGLQDGEIQLKIQKPQDIYPKIKDRLKNFYKELSMFWSQGELGSDAIQQREMGQQNDNSNISLQNQLDNIQFSQVFLPEFCTQQIKCITPKCVRKIAPNNPNDIACLNQPISTYERSSFVFKINSLKGYIGIGICIFQQVKSNKFQILQINQTGHGVFMVLQNSLVYNTNYPTHNRISGPISFKEGLKYRLIFDPWNADNKQFILQQVSQDFASYSMTMNIDETKDYRVFVHLSDQDGEVELLNEI